MKMLEKEIQSLLETHPYLIEPRFLNKPVESQKALKSGFADLVIYSENETVIIELKVVPLDNKAVLQLNGYLEDMREQISNGLLRGILIGENQKDNIYNLIKILDFKMDIKILGQDIPTSIKICEKCRFANDMRVSACNFCHSISFLKIS
jgi:RecB family endonuclease NucS